MSDSQVRLHKWVASLGIASRREAERWISEGRIKVNGKKVTQMGTSIDPAKDRVSLDDKSLKDKAPPKVYWMLHKPNKVLTSRVSQNDMPTIYDLPALKEMEFLLSPLGRLDYMTEGLLLLSNDGELANKLTHPSSEIERKYHVLIKGRLSPEQESIIRKRQVKFDDGPCPRVELKFAHRKKIGTADGSWYFISVFEGRNRIVRKLFESFGLEVKRLIRVSFGPVSIDETLKAGEYRQLSSEELRSLKKAIQRKKPVENVVEKKSTPKPKRKKES